MNKQHRTSRHRRIVVEPLESRLMLSVSPGSVDDLISLSGSRLTISDTAGHDTFEFAAGAEYRLTINGTVRTFDADTIDLIRIMAGEEDSVLLHDTAGDDVVYAGYKQTTLVAAGLTVEAIGVGEVIVVADAGGIDEAHLEDSPGDDLFDSTPTVSEMTGNGYSIRVEAFEFSHGYSRLGGNDRATLHGSDGDDLFIGRQEWSRIIGDGFVNRAKFFSQVTVYAGEGLDEAKLIDSRGDDTLHATPEQATLFGSGTVKRAVGFDVVHAYARYGGHDIANLHDSAGDERYVANSQWGKLIGDEFFVRAKFFDSVHAYADSGGHDTAQLSGTAGNDSFESRPEYSRLSGEGYEHRVGAFDEVLAKASTGDDEAVLYGSDSIDRLVAEQRSVRLTDDESSVVRQALGFNTVTAKLNHAADEATVAEDIEIDLIIERPQAGVTINAGAYLDASSPTWGLQDAIDSLPARGGVVVLPEGTFTLRQGLVLPGGVTLRGAEGGTVLVRPDRIETTLTATAATGSTVIEVASTAGFQVGGDVSILAYGETGVAHRIIAVIESGRLILDRPIEVDGTFAPAGSAAVVNYFPLVRTAWAEEETATEGVVIENLTLDGNLDETVETWRISGPSLIHLENAVDSVIRDVALTDTASGGIVLRQGHDNRIERTVIDTVRGHGIYLHGEADSVVSGVTVRQAGHATRGKAGDGILVEGSSDVVVEDSLTEGNLRYGLHPGGDLNRGGVWINNTSRDNGSNGYHFCWDNFDILVTGNLLENNGRHGVGGLGLGGPFGDRFNTVSGNVIRGNARSGIEINGGSDNTILGNTIVDNSQLDGGRFSGVVLADAIYVTVADNTIGSAGGLITQKYGVEEYGIAGHNLIVGNEFTGNVEGTVHVVSATTTVEGSEG